MTSTALRVAVLRVLADAINEQNKANRSDAEVEFAKLRIESGVKSLTVMLPDGTEIGTVAIKAGRPEVIFDDAAVLEFARKAAPTEVTEVVDPAVLDDPKVRAFIREHKPDAVSTGVTVAFKKSLKPDDDGCVVDKTTGELVKVAEVTPGKPTGAFAYTPSKDARERVVAAWKAGELGEIGGPLAPAVTPAPAPVQEWPAPRAPEAPVVEEPLPEFNPTPEGPFGEWESEPLFGDLFTDDTPGGPF